jgi:tRNA G10  N-methylase Trm11
MSRQLFSFASSEQTNVESDISVSLAYPHDTSYALKNLIAKYEFTGKAQTVSFRKLVSWIKVGERATHYIHPYPAKLLPHIAHFFLAASEVFSADDSVLDPFGGSGTVALESILSGRNVYYVDANPLARLITKVKTTPIQHAELLAAFSRISYRYLHSKKEMLAPDVVNISHWYDFATIKNLAKLKHAIAGEELGEVRDFLSVVFSTVARKSSRADPRLSVPVRMRGYKLRKCKSKLSIWELFEQQFLAACRRQKELGLLLSNQPKASCAGTDARHTQLSDSSVGLIITSPPYAGAQKYIRASSLNLGWLDLAGAGELKGLENANIGREHLPYSLYEKLTKTGIDKADRLIAKVYKKNKLRAAIVSTYIIEMSAAIIEMARVLKPGGHVVLVIGNNEVCGHAFLSSEYLAQIFLNQGFKLKLKLVDEIKSRGLMTKRNKTASVITREWVLLFEKAQDCDA